MNRLRLVVTFALFFAAGIMLPAAINDPVKTDAGLLQGTTLPTGVRVYKGIPFGAPPVGDLRWRAPQPVKPWEGVRKADTFGHVCVQPPGRGRLNVSVDLPDSPKADEDCLYLNVWTKASSAKAKMPVMFWIFGGAYTEGAGSSPHNSGEFLAQKGVVVVTTNYRLGPFGFFSHPELAKESGHNASGNQALMDVIAALKWTKANIAAFGGDPDNVTIFGESAGSSMSAGLVGSPEARGLFRRAISESGAWMGLSMAPMQPYATAEKRAVDAAEKMGAKTLAELRAKSTDDITKGIRGAGMIIDGWVVPEDESITFAQGRQNAVDILIGSNKDEGSFTQLMGRGPTADQWKQRVKQQFGDLADEALKMYPANSDEEAAKSSERAFRDNMAWHMRLYATDQAKIGKKAWLYYFTHEGPVDPGKPHLHATHTEEIPYVFGTLSAPRVYPDNTSTTLTPQSAPDRALAEVVMGYWTNFAKTGNPNGKGLPPWPQFKDTATGKAAIIGEQPPASEIPNNQIFALYDKLYAKQMATLTKSPSTK